jgi:DNA-directed RNA polymerase specialized sigma24 family protein
MFADPTAVIKALVRYTDWWQPATSSMLQVGGARRGSGFSDGIPLGLLGSLDERSEICRRMAALGERHRHVLFLWYVKQLDAWEIARELHISRRQCFRIRSYAVNTIVKMGEPAEAA